MRSLIFFSQPNKIYILGRNPHHLKKFRHPTPIQNNNILFIFHTSNKKSVLSLYAFVTILYIGRELCEYFCCNYFRVGWFPIKTPIRTFICVKIAVPVLVNYEEQ